MLKHKIFLKEEVSCSWPGKHFPEGLYIHIHQETTFCEKMPDDTHVGKEKINECCSRKSCKCLLVLRRKSMTLVLLHFHDNLEDEQWAYMRLGRAHLQLFIVIKKLYLEIFIDNIGEMFFSRDRKISPFLLIKISPYKKFHWNEKLRNDQ